MVKFKHLSQFGFKKVFVCVALLSASYLHPFNLNAQLSQQTTSPFPAQAGNVGTASGAYQPYSPFSPSQQSIFGSDNQQPDVVLYGPGGNPIGGLPLTDGTHLLFFLVLGYCGYKIIQKQRKTRS